VPRIPLIPENEFHERAEKQLRKLNPTTVEEWKRHPVTKAILLTLKGDLEGINQAWAGGHFTDVLGPHSPEWIRGVSWSTRDIKDSIEYICEEVVELKEKAEEERQYEKEINSD
jgi:hypothetical protein